MVWKTGESGASILEVGDSDDAIPASTDRVQTDPVYKEGVYLETLRLVRGREDELRVLAEVRRALGRK